MNLLLRSSCAFVFTVFLFASTASSQASFTSINTAYTQNFDTLAATTPTPLPEPPNVPFTNNSTIAGLYSNRTSYLVSMVSSTGGSLYSFGTSSQTERALGSIATNGSDTINYGVRIVNNTGLVITSLDISYTGEQWRKSGVTTSQSLTFDYRQAPSVTDITTGTYIPFSDLDFISPINTASAAALNGNLTANRTAKSATVNIIIPAGEEIMLRWTDIYGMVSNHGLAIDDLSITPRAGTLAAGASLGGRIVTSNGRGIRNVVVIVSGNNIKEPKSAKTGAFGYYNFEDLSAGATYIVTVNSKRFGFQIPSRVITLHDQIADVDFIAEP